MRTPQSKAVALSLAAGASATIALMAAGNAGITGRALQSLFYPGLAIASILRFGSHDIETVVVVLLTNTVIFGAIVLLFWTIVEACRKG